MDDVIIAAHGLGYRYGGAARPAVDDVSLAIRAGTLTAIVGPNGSGKTTLLRLLLGRLPASRGRVTLWGRASALWAPRALAQRLAVVVQREEPVFPLRVRDAVGLGRYAHLGPWDRFGPADTAAVDNALIAADAVTLADRWTTELSGGEWQRVRLARALAQAPQLLVLDEPTANLDVRHEMDVFERTAAQVAAGRTALVVTHQVNLAARFAHRVLVMHEGRLVADGTPQAVLTRNVLERVFAWPVTMIDFEGTPQFIPARKPT